MRTGISINPELDYIEALEQVSKEFDCVEIGVGEMEKEPREIDVEKFRQMLDHKELGLVVHLPLRQPLVTTVEEYNEAKIDYQKRMLEFASELGAEKAVIHANIRYGQEKEKVREDLKNQVEKLDSIAESKGLELCIENIPFDESKPADLIEFGKTMESLAVSICLDTGHAYAETDQKTLEEFIEKFSHLISHLHIQDSRGEDDHLAVGHGEIDFEPVAELLREFNGTATFEIFSPDTEYHEISRRKFLEFFE